MAKTFYRLQRFLRQAQLLFLFLGVAYIMAGSVLLLQRSNVALFQKGSYPPSPSIPLPPRSLEAPSVNWYHRRPGSTIIQDVGNNPDLSGSRGDQERFASLNLKIRHLRRHWIQGQGTDQENSAEHNLSNRDSRHKGTTWIMLKCPIWISPQNWFHIILYLHHLQGTYIGCFMNDDKQHALGGTVLYDFRKMTSSLCQDTCSERWAWMKYWI